MTSLLHDARQGTGVQPAPLEVDLIKIQKSGPGKAPARQIPKAIRRQTRRQYSAEESTPADQPPLP
jgi:hypothetical protein